MSEYYNRGRQRKYGYRYRQWVVHNVIDNYFFLTEVTSLKIQHSKILINKRFRKYSSQIRSVNYIHMRQHPWK